MCTRQRALELGQKPEVIDAAEKEIQHTRIIMVKVRNFKSLDEIKSALAESVSRKKRLEIMLRSGASAEEIRAAGINMVPIC